MSNGVPIRIERQTGKHKSFFFESLITPAIVIFLGWLLLAGAIGWSKQLQWLAIIGVGIWWLTK